MLSRSDWDARAPRDTTPLRKRDVRGVAVHWNGPRIDVRDPAATLRAIQRFHMDTKRWDDIAYSLAVFPDGSLWECRGLRLRSAANGTSTANRRYVAIYCVLGQGQDVTAEMVEGIQQAVALTRDVYPDATKILPHVVVRGGGTRCPGEQLINLCNSGGLEPGADTDVPARGPAQIHYRPEDGDGLITLGETGEDVKEIQRLLGITADGMYGPKTEATVREAQEAFGLKPDGIVGPRTRAAFFEPPAPVVVPAANVTRKGTGHFRKRHPLLAVGSEGAVVGHAQRYLGVEDDQIFGPNTRDAVIRLQRARGLQQDGKVGRETWSRLHPVLGAGDEASAVAEIQHELGVPVDNKFGPKTESALREFQATHGLTTDGIAGPQTYRAML